MLRMKPKFAPKFDRLFEVSAGSVVIGKYLIAKHLCVEVNSSLV